MVDGGWWGEPVSLGGSRERAIFNKRTRCLGRALAWESGRWVSLGV